MLCNLDPERRRVLLATLGMAGFVALPAGRAQAQEIPPSPDTTAAFLDEQESLYRLEVDFWTFGSLAANLLVASGDLEPRDVARQLRRPPADVGSVVEMLAESVGTEGARAMQDVLRSGRIDVEGSLQAAVARVRDVMINVELDPAQPVLATALEVRCTLKVCRELAQRSAPYAHYPFATFGSLS